MNMTEEFIEIVEQISALEVEDLKELAKAIRDLINEKDVSEDVNVGDLVSFEVREGATLTGLVQSTTSKRAKILLQTAEGTYSINLKNVALLQAAPPVEEADVDAGVDTPDAVA
jgi:hypothetical protein